MVQNIQGLSLKVRYNSIFLSNRSPGGPINPMTHEKNLDTPFPFGPGPKLLQEQSQTSRGNKWNRGPNARETRPDLGAGLLFLYQGQQPDQSGDHRPGGGGHREFDLCPGWEGP